MNKHGFSVCLFIGLMLGAVSIPVRAQQSASYRLDEHVLNAGGRPEGGASPTSAGFRISLDSIGDGIAARALSSASFRMDAGFANTYAPPGETLGLRFDDKATLVWDAEPSAWVYNLYRGSFVSLSASTYGGCEQLALPKTTTTDGDPVPSGDGFFYLVTVENRLGEEGTLGYRTGPVKRTGAACP